MSIPITTATGSIVVGSRRAFLASQASRNQRLNAFLHISQCLDSQAWVVERLQAKKRRTARNCKQQHGSLCLQSGSNNADALPYIRKAHSKIQVLYPDACIRTLGFCICSWQLAGQACLQLLVIRLEGGLEFVQRAVLVCLAHGLHGVHIRPCAHGRVNLGCNSNVLGMVCELLDVGNMVGGRGTCRPVGTGAPLIAFFHEVADLVIQDRRSHELF